MRAAAAPIPASLVALGGRVVTMDGPGHVIDDGVVYVRGDSIVDVGPAGDPAPDGFHDVKVVSTGGTIFPGLIELHNHLPYDVLGLWQVPRRFANRDEWSGPATPEYHQRITGPMQVLGADPDVVAAVVRFVETRCLLGGTTTSQGVTLASDPQIVTHFRGLVRNVETPDHPGLPAVATHISDVAATDASRSLAVISGRQRMILHLAEGTDSAAHDHFAALEVQPGTWAITPNLIAIHCAALTSDDFGVLAAHGGSMVWSPLSNLLLYGQTADIGAARAHQVKVALGSDWAPSGSKNLLGELKVARQAARDAGVALTDADLVAMVTRTPAQMLGWDQLLGSIEAGKLADLVVVAGTTADPYSTLVDATEAEVALVTIDGVARAGTAPLMSALGGADAGAGAETITVGGQPRVLNLVQVGADPAVAAVSVAEAQRRLAAALAALPNHTMAETPPLLPTGQVRLAVSGLVDNQMSPRPHLPLNGRLTGPNLGAAPLGPLSPGSTGSGSAGSGSAGSGSAGSGSAGSGSAGSGSAVPDMPLPDLPLPALTLDALTAIDNPGFYDTIAGEANLPASIKAALATFRP